MKKTISILMISCVFAQHLSAQCNPAFNVSIVNDRVNFVSGSSNAANVSHKWIYGDGNSTTFILGEKAVQHTYDPGHYTVIHYQTDSINNCTDSAKQDIIINYTPNCQASFNIYDSVHALWGNRYYFQDNSTHSGTGIRTAIWTVDGVIDYDISRFSFFPGDHEVCLRIETNDGCSSTYCKKIFVEKITHCGWTASFSATSSVNNKQQITFNSLPTIPNIQYGWNFGDGYISELKTPIHNYYTPGSYTVSLTMFDTINNCVDSIHKNLIVEAGYYIDSCSVNFNKSINYLNKSVTFNANSNQPVNSYMWHVNNTFSSSPSFTYHYGDTTKFLLCLDVVTTIGCKASYCETINVTDSIPLDSLSGRYNTAMILSYPNPASGSIVKMNIYLAKNGIISYKVLNSFGITLHIKEYKGLKGNNTINVPIQNLKAGQYFIELNYDAKRNKSIFIKQ